MLKQKQGFEKEEKWRSWIFFKSGGQLVEGIFYTFDFLKPPQLLWRKGSWVCNHFYWSDLDMQLLLGQNSNLFLSHLHWCKFDGVTLICKATLKHGLCADQHTPSSNVHITRCSWEHYNFLTHVINGDQTVPKWPRAVPKIWKLTFKVFTATVRLYFFQTPT